jgi:serine/threonine-protein kinase RsbW
MFTTRPGPVSDRSREPNGAARRRKPAPAGGPPAGPESVPLDACWYWESRPDAEDLHVVLDFVAEAMAVAGYGDADLFAVRLALAEALGNAVRYAQRGDRTKPVRVRHHVDARRVLVEVEDQGEGFDPASVPDPRAAEDGGQPGGRGLLRMGAFPDGVGVNRRGNCVTLCKYRCGR